MKLSLKKQMIILFSVAFSLIAIISDNVILSYSVTGFRNQSYEYCRQIVETNNTLLDTYFQQMKDVSMIIANDTDVIEAVTYRNTTGIADYPTNLFYQRKVMDKIKQIDILGNIETSIIIGKQYQYLYYYGNSPKRNYNFETQDWFMQTIKKDGYTTHFTGYHNTDYLLTSDGKDTISIITPILNTSQYISAQVGYLMCDFQISSIISGTGARETIPIAIYDGLTPVYFSSSGLLSKEQQEMLANHLAQGQETFMLGRDNKSFRSYLVVSQTSRISGWTILGLKPLTEIDNMRTSVISFTVAIIGVSILVVVLLSLLVSKSILIPIDKLVKSFNRIAHGETEVHFDKSNSGEVNLLAQTAQEMLDHISELTKDLIYKQEQFSKEQLKALQNQINPHFLNNTLQSIKSLAVAGEVASVSGMTTLLGKLLTYSVYEPFGKVRLSEELQYTENYIILQKIRYPGIDYSIDCEECIKEISVPKLIIQPLVENSIEHGFSGSKNGCITICADADVDEIHIIVADNGNGISEEKSREIMYRLENRDPGDAPDGIGLLNVHKRIQSIYGDRYGISILSRTGMNTSVIISVPRQDKEEESKPCLDTDKM